MMTVMMTVVAVAYWRWDSRVTERNISFRSEVFTTAQESELKDTDIPTLHQLNEEYSKVAQLVERVLVSIDTTGVTNVTQPSEDGQSVIEKRLAGARPGFRSHRHQGRAHHHRLPCHPEQTCPAGHPERRKEPSPYIW